MAASDWSASPPRVSDFHRGRRGAIVLGLALLGAPAAWFVQLLVGAGLAGLACDSPSGPVTVPAWSGVWAFLFVLSLLAIGFALAAGFAALRDLRGNRASTRAAPTMPDEPLTEAGQNRDLFLAAWAVMTSASFLVALIFATTALVFVPVCHGWL